jgi:hypothetical protein
MSSAPVDNHWWQDAINRNEAGQLVRPLSKCIGYPRLAEISVGQDWQPCRVWSRSDFSQTASPIRTTTMATSLARLLSTTRHRH